MVVLVKVVLFAVFSKFMYINKKIYTLVPLYLLHS
jgi:hypothetical protein